MFGWRNRPYRALAVCGPDCLGLRSVTRSDPGWYVAGLWPWRIPSAAGSALEDAGLDVAEALQEELVIGHGFFHKLFEQKQFGAVDDGMDALLEGFHGGEGLERIANQQDGGMPALAAGHDLQGLEGEILIGRVGAEQFLHQRHLIAHLAEAHQEIAVGGGGVDFIAEFLQGVFGLLQPFRRGKGDQRRLVICTDEIKCGVCVHPGLFDF